VTTVDAVTTPALEALVQRLCRESEVDPDQIRGIVVAIHAEFAEAPVQTFVPVLVERRLRDILRAQRRVVVPPAPRAASG
jgi:ribosomal protein L12E/L44/L45/RPP1/RPP2